MTQDLAALREQIDQIDDQLLALLDQRMELAKQVAQAKQETGKAIFDPEREKQLFERLEQKLADKHYDSEKIIKIWEPILEISRDVQNR